jgi:hypothetical protein
MEVVMSKVENNDENAEICKNFCGPCLTNPGVEGELLFCARGKSSSPKSKNGCNCGMCDVKRKYLCSGLYFCIEGTCE